MWMHHDFYCVGSNFFVSAMLLAYTLGGACGACALHFVFRWLLCKRMCPGTESHEGLLQMIFRISIGWFSASVCCQVVVSIISIFTLILGEMIQFDLTSLHWKLTAKAPENGSWECNRFLWPIFRGELLVSGRVICLNWVGLTTRKKKVVFARRLRPQWNSGWVCRTYAPQNPTRKDVPL